MIISTNCNIDKQDINTGTNKNIYTRIGVHFKNRHQKFRRNIF